MNTHDLKTHPDHFEAVWGGVKTAELRKDDRGFAVGDTLLLREWEPVVYGETFAGLVENLIDAERTPDALERAHEAATEAAYTGEVVRARITHILRGGPWLADGYAMLSFDRFDPDCYYCEGLGEYYGHADTCADELCALNGDMHSCAGQMWPCDCAKLVAVEPPPHPGVAATEAR